MRGASCPSLIERFVLTAMQRKMEMAREMEMGREMENEIWREIKRVGDGDSRGRLEIDRY